MPENKQVRIHYTGVQPLVFVVGRKTKKDAIGNVTVETEGREIRLVPSARLPADQQHQPVNADDWKAIRAHPVMGPTVKHLLDRGEIHVYGE